MHAGWRVKVKKFDLKNCHAFGVVSLCARHGHAIDQFNFRVNFGTRKCVCSTLHIFVKIAQRMLPLGAHL